MLSESFEELHEISGFLGLLIYFIVILSGLGLFFLSEKKGRLMRLHKVSFSLFLPILIFHILSTEVRSISFLVGGILIVLPASLGISSFLIRKRKLLFISKGILTLVGGSLLFYAHSNYENNDYEKDKVIYKGYPTNFEKHEYEDEYDEYED